MGLGSSRAQIRVTVTLSWVAPPGKTCFRILLCSQSGFLSVSDQAEPVGHLFGLAH